MYVDGGTGLPTISYFVLFFEKKIVLVNGRYNEKKKNKTPTTPHLEKLLDRSACTGSYVLTWLWGAGRDRCVTLHEVSSSGTQYLTSPVPV